MHGSLVHSSHTQEPGHSLTLLRRQQVLLPACLALLVLRDSSLARASPSDKLRQVGHFDVQVANVDVPRDLRQVDVFYCRHSARRGCRKATLRREER